MAIAARIALDKDSLVSVVQSVDYFIQIKTCVLVTGVACLEQ